MSKAFSAILGDQFILICGRSKFTDETFTNDIKFYPISTSNNFLIKRMQFALKTIKEISNKKKIRIFTRDITIALTAALLNKEVIYEAHRPPKGITSKAITKLLSKSKKVKIVAISAALKKYYVTNFGYVCNNILTAHDGVFPELYRPIKEYSLVKNIRNELNLPLEKKIVVHTGSLYKGGGELFEHIARAAGFGSLVIHIGGNYKENKKWKNYYLSKQIENIQFIPHQAQEKVRKYQLCADLLFYINTKKSPIYWCTSPLKIFEYMAAGVPIIASTIGSVGEILNNSNAFCFDPEEPKTIYNCWYQYQSDPNGARQKANKAREEIEKYYSWHLRARNILNFYDAT